MAKSSAAPATPQKLDFIPEELAEGGYHVSGRGPAIAFAGKIICRFPSGPSKAAQKRAESYARLFIRTADSHQALYEALSAAESFIFCALAANFRELYPDKKERDEAIANHLTMKQITAALALADAAKEQK